MKDSKIDILYDPNNPSKIVQVPSISKNNIGWILVVCGLVLLIITGGYYFLTKKSSAFISNFILFLILFLILFYF